MKVFIIWENKMSGETGYVKGINLNEGHIDATWEFDEVKIYASAGVAKGLITKLKKMGAEQQNNFYICLASVSPHEGHLKNKALELAKAQALLML